MTLAELQHEIDDLCSFRDACARNCAVAVLEGDMAMAAEFAKRFDRYQHELAALYVQPKPHAQTKGRGK